MMIRSELPSDCPPPSLIGRFLIAIVRAYQVSLSPYIGRDCRFLPTCSDYFIEAVLRKGAFRGAFMGIWRILRCNPFSKGGYDPVE
jgi:putative membrane protein insertion efficiency factor